MGLFAVVREHLPSEVSRAEGSDRIWAKVSVTDSRYPGGALSICCKAVGSSDKVKTALEKPLLLAVCVLTLPVCLPAGAQEIRALCNFTALSSQNFLFCELLFFLI